jgi:uncharacterized protein involved in outer membrane biogenesis
LQTTLLGIGLALILALLAALFGPHFIDWGSYRAILEQRASETVGVPVRIAGRIDARLLPTPAITINDVAAVETEPRFRVRSISMELGLGALMRGEWRITELSVRGPELRVGVDRDGQLNWRSAGFPVEPEKLSIERLDVEGGRLLIRHTASASSLALDGVSFRGDLRSLIGPIKGEGDFSLSGKRYGYRVSSSRATDDGAMRVRLSLLPGSEPVSADADGLVRVDSEGLKFDGTLNMGRQGEVVLIDGRARRAEGWRLSGKLKADARNASLEQLELQYGAEERAIKLGGGAELKLEAKPHITATLSARQVDIDRFLEAADQRVVPLTSVRNLLGEAREFVQPPLPTRVSLSVDVLTLGGAPLQNVQAEVALDGAAANVERLELRAPGITTVRASGAAGFANSGWTFSGPASIESQEPRALAAWLEGHPASPSQPTPLRASGEIRIAPDRIAVENVNAQFDGRAVAGRFVYVPGADRPRYEVDLRASDLDLDAADAFVRAALPNASFARPAELALSLDLGRAVFAGFEARGVNARIVADASRLAIERLRIAEIAGGAIEASGTIDDVWTAPRGSAKLTLSTDRIDRFAHSLAWLWPSWAGSMRLPENFGPARLEAELNATQSDATTHAKAKLRGTVGATRVRIEAEGDGQLQNWQAATARFDAEAASDDGQKLAALMRLDEFGVVGRGPASLRMSAQGPLGGDLRFDAQVSATGLTLNASGIGRLAEGAQLTAEIQTSVAAADMPLLRPLIGAPATVSLASRVLLQPEKITFSDISGTLAAAPLTGRIELSRSDKADLSGALEIETINLANVAGALSGSGTPPATGRGWPTQVFDPLWAKTSTGRVALRAKRAHIGASGTIQDFRGVLRFSETEAAIDNIEGSIARGRMRGNLVLQGGPGSLAAAVRVGVTGADVGDLLGSAARAAAGRVSFDLNLDGTGRSAATLASTISGSGTVAFENLDLAGLDPQVFEAVIRAVDQGTPIEAAAVRKVAEAAFDKGRIRVARGEGALNASVGQLRWANVNLQGGGADLAGSASLDLSTGLGEGRLAFVGPSTLGDFGAGRPEVNFTFRGPLAAPQRAIDVAPLVGWLTLRSVDLQAKRIEALEAERRDAERRDAERREAERRETERRDVERKETERRDAERRETERREAERREAERRAAERGAAERREAERRETERRETERRETERRETERRETERREAERREAERRAAEAAAAAVRQSAPPRDAITSIPPAQLDDSSSRAQPPAGANNRTPAQLPASRPANAAAGWTPPNLPQDRLPQVDPSLPPTTPPPAARRPAAVQAESIQPLPPPVDVRPPPGSSNRRPAPPPAARPTDTFSPRALFDSIFGGGQR